MMKHLLIRPFAMAMFVIATCSCSNGKKKELAKKYGEELLQRIRAAATTIPGEAPRAIGYMKYAESRRKWSSLVEGGGEDTGVMARTVFQILYANEWIMVDAGMDRQVHQFFEKEGSPQPFDDAKADSVRMAVEGAKLVLITHEHGDHVAGAIRTAATGSVPRKTMLTREQADALIKKPQMPEIALTEEKSKQYIITGFEDIQPVAPGVVLIKAPGHTPGEIMIYAKLQNGREYIFTGDVSWTYKGIADNKPKPSAERKRLGEDGDEVALQLKWLNGLMKNERVIMLVSHDDVMLPQLAAQGLILGDINLNVGP